MKQPQSTLLSIKVIPNSSRSIIAGWVGDLLKIKVTAQPEKGKANKEVEAVMAKSLNLSKKDVSVISGKTSQYKTIQINGLSYDNIMAKLQKIMSS